MASLKRNKTKQQLGKFLQEGGVTPSQFGFNEGCNPTPTYMGTHLQSGLLLGRSGLLCNPLLYLHNLVAVIGMIGVMRIQEVELGVPSLIQSDTSLKLRSYKYTVNTHCTCMSLEDGMYTHKQPNSPKKNTKKKQKDLGNISNSWSTYTPSRTSDGKAMIVGTYQHCFPRDVHAGD